MRSDLSETPSSNEAAGSAWGARGLALILGIGVLLLGLLAIDEAGRRAPGESMLAVTVPLKIFVDEANDAAARSMHAGLAVALSHADAITVPSASRLLCP